MTLIFGLVAHAFLLQCQPRQKQEALDCGHVRESRADATSNQVLSSEEKATEGAPAPDRSKLDGFNVADFQPVSAGFSFSTY